MTSMQHYNCAVCSDRVTYKEFNFKLLLGFFFFPFITLSREFFVGSIMQLNKKKGEREWWYPTSTSRTYIYDPLTVLRFIKRHLLFLVLLSYCRLLTLGLGPVLPFRCVSFPLSQPDTYSTVRHSVLNWCELGRHESNRFGLFHIRPLAATIAKNFSYADLGYFATINLQLTDRLQLERRKASNCSFEPVYLFLIF